VTIIDAHHLWDLESIFSGTATRVCSLAV